MRFQWRQRSNGLLDTRGHPANAGQHRQQSYRCHLSAAAPAPIVFPVLLEICAKFADYWFCAENAGAHRVARGQRTDASNVQANRAQLQVSTILKTSEAGRDRRVHARASGGGHVWFALVGSVVLGCATAARAADETGLVVKVYACPTGQASATAERLRTEFGPIAGVRIAADERTAKVIAQAPPAVQARISQRLAALMPGQTVQAAGASGPAGGASPSRSISLHRVKTEQVEASLWSMLGNRLSALPSSRPQARRYRLALAGGGRVEKKGPP